LCALIDYHYKNNHNILTSLNNVTKEIKGSYACAIMKKNNKNKIYVIKKDSPLVIGVGNNENFIASDILAILKYTNKYILLDDNDVGEISLNKVTIYNNNIKTNKEILEFKHNKENMANKNFEHYMLKEIHEESLIVKNNIPTTLDNIPDISNYNNIYIVGCGSAYNAGTIGKHLLEKYTSKMISTEIASEFRYKNLNLNKDDLLILISQSGETADTIACLRNMKKLGITTLSIVNVVGSTIYRESDIVINTNAGAEISVATTKAYLMQIFILSLIAIKNSKLQYKNIIEYYKALPNQIDNAINKNYKDIANKIYKERDIYFLGRGIDYYISMEGNLKLKEISYIHSEAYPSGELKHGSIALIDNNTFVISIITDKLIKDKTLSNIKEVISIGAKSIIICTDDIKIDKTYYDYLIKIPTTIDLLKPLLVILPLQLIAYEVAKLKGCDIDKPKNLAKSVTVE